MVYYQQTNGCNCHSNCHTNRGPSSTAICERCHAVNDQDPDHVEQLINNRCSTWLLCCNVCAHAPRESCFGPLKLCQPSARVDRTRGQTNKQVGLDNRRVTMSEGSCVFAMHAAPIHTRPATCQTCRPRVGPVQCTTCVDRALSEHAQYTIPGKTSAVRCGRDRQAMLAFCICGDSVSPCRCGHPLTWPIHRSHPERDSH